MIYISSLRKFKLSIGVFMMLISVQLSYCQVKVDQQDDVGIGTLAPLPSAKLHIESSSKGFLKPRMTTAQMMAISNPTQGLEIYNTTENQTYWYNGSAWVHNNGGIVTAGTGISVTGNGTVATPYIVSSTLGSTSFNLGNVQRLLFYQEDGFLPSNPNNPPPHLLLSGASLSFTIPANNNYSNILIEVVTKTYVNTNINLRPNFTWRILKYENGSNVATVLETYEQRIVSTSLTNIQGGGTYTNTISTIIPGGSATSMTFEVSVQPSVSCAECRGKVESFRVYGIGDAVVPTLIGPIGPAGPSGNQGQAGPANNLTVGTVSTGIPGSPASATITGTSPNQILNLTIPAGIQGSTGPTGLTGPAGQGGVSTAGAGINIVGQGTTSDPYIISNTRNGTVSSVTGISPINVTNTTTTPVVSLADGGVNTIKLASNAVSTDKIQHSAVIPSKIAPGNVDQILATTISGVAWTNLSTLLNTNTWNLNGNLQSSEKWLGTSNAYDLPFRTNNIEQMRLLTNGNLGIGTSTPDHKLTLSKANEVGLKLTTQNNSSYFGELKIRSDAQDAMDLTVLGTRVLGVKTPGSLTSGTYLNSLNSLYLTTGSANPDQNYVRMTILADGKIGIGTSSPSRQLDINGSSRFRGAIHDKDDQAGNNNEILVSTNTNIDWKDIGVLAWKLGGNTLTGSSTIGTNNDFPLQFKVNNVNRWVIDNIGRLKPFNNMNNFLIGHAANANFTGSDNILIGTWTGSSLTSGSSNLCIGNGTGENITSGNGNVFIGNSTAMSSDSAYFNTFVGTDTGQENTTGSFNTFIGINAGNKNETGEGNTFVGNYAGSGYGSGASINYGNSTGWALTILGNGASTTTDGLFNATALGNSALVSNSNSVRIGDANISSIGGYACWSNVSDKRFKVNVSENIPGIDFIKLLKPITYNLNVKGINDYLGIDENSRDTISERNKFNIINTGFNAQDVEQAAKSINYNFSGVDKPEDEKSLYGLRYSLFVVPLVKAVQEQQVMIDSLEKQKSDLQAELTTLKGLLAEIDARLKILESK